MQFVVKKIDQQTNHNNKQSEDDNVFAGVLIHLISGFGFQISSKFNHAGLCNLEEVDFELSSLNY